MRSYGGGKKWTYMDLYYVHIHTRIVCTHNNTSSRHCSYVRIMYVYNSPVVIIIISKRGHLQVEIRPYPTWILQPPCLPLSCQAVSLNHTRATGHAATTHSLCLMNSSTEGPMDGGGLDLTSSSLSSSPSNQGGVAPVWMFPLRTVLWWLKKG